MSPKTKLYAAALTAAVLTAGTVAYKFGYADRLLPSQTHDMSAHDMSGHDMSSHDMSAHQMPDSKTGAEGDPSAAASKDRKVLFYRNPMGLPDTSPVPKKDTMGMDYLPVYEGEDDADNAATVKVSIAKIQRSGVRTTPATLRKVTRPVRAPGVAKPDERSLYSVTLRSDSFIEKLYVNENGMHVQKGEPLFKVYSPDMVRVQVDYRISTADGGNRDESGALQRLENLQLPDAVVQKLKRTRQPIISFDWPSPVTGFVLKKNVVEGMMMKAGDELFRVADLSSMWVIADVSEQDIGQVKAGQKARISFKAFPGEVFEGKVTFVLHELNMSTRTAQVRIELPNPDHRIKHEMFADVEIDTGDNVPEQVAVPLSALIDSGNRAVVIVGLGDGRFEPREVKVGRRGEHDVAITEGLKAGEDVVVSANFLIDAESNLKAALSRFSEADPASDAPVMNHDDPLQHQSMDDHSAHMDHGDHKPAMQDAAPAAADHGETHK